MVTNRCGSNLSVDIALFDHAQAEAVFEAFKGELTIRHKLVSITLLFLDYCLPRSASCPFSSWASVKSSSNTSTYFLCTPCRCVRMLAIFSGEDFLRISTTCARSFTRPELTF